MGLTARHRRDEFSRRAADHLPIGIGAGAIGAILAGLGEAILIRTTHPAVTDPVLFPYTIFCYGILGAVMGAGLGIVGVGFYNLTADKFTLHRSAATYLGITFSALAFFLVRFRVFRDVFDEKVRTFGSQGLLVTGGLFLGAVLALLLIRVALGELLRQELLKGLATPAGSLACWLFLLATSGIAFGYTSHRHGFELTTDSRSSVPPTGGICDVAALKPSVILIIVDTLRADVLGAYGRTPSFTPNLDALARDGVVFQNAVAQASWTRPAVASILTSRLPSSHTAIHKDSLLPSEVETVAETLQARCYATSAIVDNYNISAKNGFGQGFDRFTYLQPEYLFLATDLSSELAIYNILRKVGEKYLHSAKLVQHYYQDAGVVTDTAIGRVKKDLGSRTFFLLLHYMDPHDPYFVHPYTGEAYARVTLGAHPDSKLAARLREVYEGEVSFFDGHLGRFLETLRQAGLYEKSWIILTADHGEEFFEHGGWWHGDTLYDEQIHVPLIVKPPASADPWASLGRTQWPAPAPPVAEGEAPADPNTASPAPAPPAQAQAQEEGYRVITGLARQIDIAPTILSVAGVRDMPAGTQGQSLTVSEPLASAVAEEDFEGNVLQAIRTPEWKLITANPGNPRGLPAGSLFAIQSDPGEQTNLYEPNRPEVKPLTSEMEAALKGAKTAAATAETTVKPSTAEQENLNALGYGGK